MKLKIRAGSTSKIARIYIQDSSSTTGAGLTGLAYNSAGLTWYWIRTGDVGATAVTLATATLGTFTSGGFKEVSVGNMPGVYEIGIPNAAIASGADSVHMLLKGATNMAPVPIEIELDAVDYQDATAFGISRLDAAITSRMATFTLPTNFSSLAITVGGAVTAGTVSDKTGYSLSQAFPTNFSSLAIDVSGRTQIQYGTSTGQLNASAGNLSNVTVTTNSDKTGYSLATAPPTAAAITSAVLTTQMTESYHADGTAPTLAQALHFLIAALTEFSISGTTITLKKLDGSTTAGTLTINSSTTPTSVTRAT